MQQQDARKNYIGLVNDATEEERLADSAARLRPRVMSYLARRLAAMLRRSVEAAPGRSIKS
ncbi:hypothetical protein AC629_22745 [Bradyrhizobium sp. NAS80.1]|nr:hypothetical protein [Bradyrhizobium sp. NAS80.1]OKO83525.1 hypothetical protein AC629_22745 [Bradyrhizobium sp. NAS80.1]